MKKIYLFGVSLLIFSVAFFSCSTVSNSTASPGLDFKSVPSTDKRNYVVMKDSSVVQGEKVVGWGDGALNKKVVKIDGKQIPAEEVLGFQTSQNYWSKLGSYGLARRLVPGRISVYLQQIDRPGGGSYRTYFFQKAGGPLREISGMEELKQMMRDCPKAYAMINIPDEEYNNIIKKQPYYTQTIIETYNSCGEWN